MAKRSLYNKLEEIYNTSNIVNELWDSGYLDNDLNLKKDVTMENIISHLEEEGFTDNEVSSEVVEGIISEAKRYCALIK
jgi:hypothetical protein